MTGAANEPWLIYALIFGCAVLAAFQLQLGIAGVLRDRNRARRWQTGFHASHASAPRPGLRRVAIARFAPRARLDLLILQSGTRASARTLAIQTLGLGILLAVFAPAPGWIPRLAVGVLASALSMGLFLRIKRARRLARFSEQLPEVIDVVVRSLRAGHPLPVSLALVARETPAPAGPEFAWAVDEIQYGRSVGEALAGLRDRVGDPELGFLVAAVAIASQTGGNLGEILARLARTLRDRFRLKRRVRALSAEGRFSGYALSALPIILFGLINLVSAQYYNEFWQSPISLHVLGTAIALLLVGNLVIYRLVNFDA